MQISYFQSTVLDARFYNPLRLLENFKFGMRADGQINWQKQTGLSDRHM
jgi:hypothetical protein